MPEPTQTPATPLDRLRHAANELAAIEDSMEALNARLKDASAEKNRLETEVLPSLFAEAGLRTIQTTHGATIGLRLIVSGSLPKERDARDAAVAWLAANGCGDLLSCEVTAKWARGDRETALEHFNALRRVNSAAVTLDEGIHAQTLQAEVRRRIVGGEPVPLDLLGVTALTRAKTISSRSRGE